MKRPAQIALVAVVAVLVSGSALARPVRVWAEAAALQSCEEAKVLGAVTEDFSVNGRDIALATWGYSGRSWTTFGKVVAGAFESAGRLVRQKSSAQVAGASTIKEEIQKTPETPDLSGKLIETKALLNELSFGVKFASSKADLLGLRWNERAASESALVVSELASKFGQDDDSSVANTISGRVAYLRENWDWDSASALAFEAAEIRNLLADQPVLNYSQVNDLVSRMAMMDSLIGEATDAAGNRSAFGQLAETKKLTKTLDDKEAELLLLLASGDTFTLAEKKAKLNVLARDVFAVNRVPKAEGVLLTSDLASETKVKNVSLATIGVVAANRTLLAGPVGAPVTANWLELGSVVYKTLLSNPSNVRQKLVLSYFLPAEVKREDLLGVDSGLTTTYDLKKKQFFVKGEFLLEPFETKTVAVRVKDKWVFGPGTTENLRLETSVLSGTLLPLSSWPYFSAAVGINRDIDALLGNVEKNLQVTYATPEERIKAFQEGRKNLLTTSEKVAQLREMSKVLTGSRRLALWGLVVVALGGVIFLVIKFGRKEHLQKASGFASGLGLGFKRRIRGGWEIGSKLSDKVSETGRISQERLVVLRSSAGRKSRLLYDLQVEYGGRAVKRVAVVPGKMAHRLINSSKDFYGGLFLLRVEAGRKSRRLYQWQSEYLNGGKKRLLEGVRWSKRATIDRMTKGVGQLGRQGSRFSRAIQGRLIVVRDGAGRKSRLLYDLQVEYGGRAVKSLEGVALRSRAFMRGQGQLWSTRLKKVAVVSGKMADQLMNSMQSFYGEYLYRGKKRLLEGARRSKRTVQVGWGVSREAVGQMARGGNAFIKASSDGTKALHGSAVAWQRATISLVTKGLGQLGRQGSRLGRATGAKSQLFYVLVVEYRGRAVKRWGNAVRRGSGVAKDFYGGIVISGQRSKLLLKKQGKLWGKQVRGTVGAGSRAAWEVARYARTSSGRLLERGSVSINAFQEWSELLRKLVGQMACGGKKVLLRVGRKLPEVKIPSFPYLPRL